MLKSTFFIRVFQSLFSDFPFLAYHVVSSDGNNKASTWMHLNWSHDGEKDLGGLVCFNDQKQLYTWAYNEAPTEFTISHFSWTLRIGMVPTKKYGDCEKAQNEQQGGVGRASKTEKVESPGILK